MTVPVYAVLILLLAGMCIFLSVRLREMAQALEHETEKNKFYIDIAVQNSKALVDTHSAYLSVVETNANLVGDYNVLMEKNFEKQDKLSAILCPTNNHLWDDVGGGVKRCRRCGLERMVEDA